MAQTSSRGPTTRSKRSLWVVVLLLLLGGGVAVIYTKKDSSLLEGGSENATNLPASTSTSRDGSASALSPVALPERDRPESLVESLVEKYDASADVWDTEVLSDLTMKQLKVVSKLIEHPEDIDLDHTGALVDANFSCEALRPENANEVYERAHLTVRRPEANAPRKSFVGAQGLVDALRSLVAGLGKGKETRVKFKLFRIERSESFFETRLFFEASNIDAARVAQQSSTWLCRWSYPTDTAAAKPRLQHIALELHEEVDLESTGGALFQDCTESALGHNASYARQVLPGIPFWLARISREFMTQFGHHGLAVGDVNGDGLEDFYACDAGGLPNRLYVQQPDGTFTDQARESGVDWLDNTVAALLIDLDNDGDQDLIVSTELSLLFAKNDGRGRFSSPTMHRTVIDPYSLSAADYDDDGDLDLFVCCYGGDTRDPFNKKGLPFPLPYHDANNGGANIFLRNEFLGKDGVRGAGDGFEFSDVTIETGLDRNNSRFSLAASWEDFDNDGDLDLYVANDFGRNNLYRNDGGRFTDVASESGVEDIASGMSVSWGDFNRDGWMDVYVSNMFSAAGNRVTYQRQFGDHAASDTVPQVQRMARGNTLFTSTGNGTFLDTSESAGVTMGRWAWCSKFADLNNDAWLDLVVANGYVTAEDTGDL